MKRDRSSQGRAPLELDERELSSVVGGYVGDQDLSEFHPLAWPRIRIADLGQVVVNPGSVVQKVGIH
ncbi:hypothetical protein [Archangium sp.]|jgi:hypothetical protein|uniref:hypothetical protein n=1 Tax=Archangium sp. TaxID=1872627 RepID=UPI002ED9BD99